MVEEHGLEQVHYWASQGGLPAGFNTEAGETIRRGTEWSRESGTDIDTTSLYRSAGAQAETEPAGDAGVPDAVRAVVSEPGQPLEASVREEMEAKLGTSFEDVRIHTGVRAAAAASAVDARAFTVGNHVAFGRGEYDPESESGRYLIAHELAHVRQSSRKRALQRCGSESESGAASGGGASGGGTSLQERYGLPATAVLGPDVTEAHMETYRHQKHDPETTRFVVTDQEGKVCWLEQGNERAGWTHIISRHGGQFEELGFEGDTLRNAIMNAIQYGTEGTSKGRRQYKDNLTETKNIVVGVGSNGFVVTAHPKRKK
ncbi:eCIS core domain-containing protein [Natronobiforma cellulositropha]|uniref:eCIS core domain-containing protein n=1 Tax=Natronobiforma cellulositropha TaxID=1679076 RepID=UPI0021D59788|nr:DUF4157 domain-containing protein [Natronobiforma cellulositropha]